MSKSLLVQALLVAGAAVGSFAPVIADSVTTTTTTVESDAPAAPVIVTTPAKEITVNSVTTTVAPAGTVVAKVVFRRPDDFVERKKELVDAVVLERNAGRLSAAQADSLLARINQLDNEAMSLHKDESTEYYKTVKRIYAGYDRVQDDIARQSGDKDLNVLK